MLKSTFLACLVGLLSLSSVKAQSDIQHIKENVVKQTITAPHDDTMAKESLNSMLDDGSWADIDYKNLSLAGFDHFKHIDRTQNMVACYVSKNSSLYQNTNLLTAINKSLAFWCRHDFIAADWWYNLIFLPSAFLNIAFSIEKDIQPESLAKIKEIISRSNLSSPWARPSADRIKICDIAAKYHILCEDDANFQKLLEHVLGEIKFSTGNRGLQSDYSFHHRVHRENNTNTYGAGYGKTCAQWGGYVEGTKYELTQDRKELIVNLWLDGLIKMRAFGCYDEKGVNNREISRFKEPGRYSSEELGYLLDFTQYRQDEIKELIDLCKGELDKPTLSYSKFFPQSEFFSFQRPDFYASVRMYSTRNRNHELAHSSEAVMSHHKGDGANHIYTVGNEYDNIWPMFDWQRIPGATIAQKKAMPSENALQKDGLTTFVGAATDGLYGAVGFEFISPHDFTHAKKSWFFFDKEYVCLGAGIGSNSFSTPIVTSINQCRLVGDVRLADGSTLKAEEKKVIATENVPWVQHNGLAYIFFDSQQVTVSNQTQSGSWYKINHRNISPKEEESMPLFSLWIDHGIRPQGDTYSFRPDVMDAKDTGYSYMIAPCPDASQVDTDRGVELLSNTHLLQAARNNKLKMTQAVFYEAGELKLSNTQSLTAYMPLIVIMKEGADGAIELTVSDPHRSHSRAFLHLTGYGDITIDLPQGDDTGNSVSLRLECKA